jgi:DNA adenine methylase
MPLSHPTGSESEARPREAKPFLKWAGGKKQLLAQYEPLLPTRFSRYFEPFVGGGAVFFHLWNTGRLPAEACLLDHNDELVSTYRAVRDDVEALIARLADHQANHSKDYYYRIRALDRGDAPLTGVERAARTIYLNRTCYNGLYRVNRKGQFNVPLGRYENPTILDEARLRTAHEALQGVSLEVRDFRSLPELAEPGDFFYFDPPYDPLSKTASFTSYTWGSFRDEDQRDLAEVFTRLAGRGCLCMLSNSHTPFILDLYREHRIEVVTARRAISSDGAGRGEVKEVVVLSF